MNDEKWRADAVCKGADPDLFHPTESGRGTRQDNPYTEQIAQAMAMCDRCPVRAQCLGYALKHRIKMGVWGGKTASQRDQLLRRQPTNA